MSSTQDEGDRVYRVHICSHIGVTEKDGMHPLLLHANCLLFLCALYTVLAEANRVMYDCMSLCIEHVYCW